MQTWINSLLHGAINDSYNYPGDPNYYTIQNAPFELPGLLENGSFMEALDVPTGLARTIQAVYTAPLVNVFMNWFVRASRFVRSCADHHQVHRCHYQADTINDGELVDGHLRLTDDLWRRSIL